MAKKTGYANKTYSLTFHVSGEKWLKLHKYHEATAKKKREIIEEALELYFNKEKSCEQ